MRIRLFFSFIALFLLAAASIADQVIAEPDAIVIMKSEGAYLNIFPDGSAKAGFGALRHCAEMPAGTFDFSQLLQIEFNEEEIRRNEKRDASGSYVAVGFSRNSSARTYHYDNRSQINALFEHAERNANIIDGDIICPFAAD